MDETFFQKCSEFQMLKKLMVFKFRLFPCFQKGEVAKDRTRERQGNQ